MDVCFQGNKVRNQMRHVNNLAEDVGGQSNHQTASLTICLPHSGCIHANSYQLKEARIPTRSNPPPIPQLFDCGPAVTSIEHTNPLLLPYDYFMSVDGRGRMRWRFSVIISDQELE